MRKRKAISAAIVLGGLVLFIAIINLPSGNGSHKSPSDGGSTAGLDSGLQFQVNQNRNTITNPTPANGKPADTDNLTDQVAQGLSQNILQMNNGFDQGTSTIKLPSSDSLGDAIGQAASGQNLKFPVFGEKDIRIGSDNSPSAQIAYIKSLGDITKNNFGNFNTPIVDILNNFFEKNDSSALAKYVDIAGKETGDLLALKVPQQLSSWHLQNLNLWEKKIVVYKAILDLSDDPLKATLAIQQVNGVGQENENIQKVLNDHIKKLTTNG